MHTEIPVLLFTALPPVQKEITGAKSSSPTHAQSIGHVATEVYVSSTNMCTERDEDEER